MEPLGDGANTPRETLKRAGTVGAYLALGFVGTAVVAVALLNVSRPLQGAIYDLFYLQVGPSEATETAILTQFIAVCVVAISVPVVLGDYLSDRLEHREAFARAIAATVLPLVAFLVVALARLASFLTAAVVLAAVFVAIPVALRYRYGVRSGGVPAFVGGIPVVLLLLLATGFGLGWGWGYVVTAQEVPATSVNGTAASFDGVPEVRDDLFESGDCETDPDGRRVCRLFLRGYEHETATARFLARHGVRCPYQNAPSTSADPERSFIARHDGTYYRVSCSPHGD